LFRADWDQLLLAARSGDGGALGRLLEVAGDDLRCAAASVLGRATQKRLRAEDVFADAMIVVLREIGSLRATNYVGFRYWFASIARNHVRRTMRSERERAGSQVNEDPEDDRAKPEPRTLSAESYAFLRHALVRLPKTQRVAFVLREGLALSWTTIGFVLERRREPAARLIHYRSVLRMKELASQHPPRVRCATSA
jgi:RNA polymerase sigma factor (sigma-70 family)